MTTDERLQSMIRACVEADVRDLSLPVDLADRVIAGRKRFRPRARMPIFLAGLATAVALIAAPVAVKLTEPAEQPPQSVVVVKPEDYNGRISISALPGGLRQENGPGATPSVPGTFVEIEPIGDTRVWTAAFGVKRKLAIVKVMSGDLDLEGAIVHSRVVPNIDGTQPVDLGQGRAVSVVRSDEFIVDRYLFWELRPGLVITLKCQQLTQTELISIAKAVEIK